MALKNQIVITLSAFLLSGTSEIAAQIFSGDPISHPAVSNMVGIDSADFSGDGVPDIVVLESNRTSTIHLFTNDGSGSFERATLAVELTNGSQEIRAFDVDADGDQDIVMLRYSGGGIATPALRNDGGGTFAPISLGIQRVRDLQIAEVTGDNNADVIGVIDTRLNEFGQTLPQAVFVAPDGVNLVGAVLTPAESSANNFDLNAIADGDFDRDGDRDVATIPNSVDGSLGLFLNDGSGAFFQQRGPDLLGVPNHLVTGDFNGDGFPDLAITVFSSIRILLNVGGDTLFSEGVDYGTAIGPTEPLVIDLDGDRDADLITSGSADNRVAMHLNNGDGTFATPVYFDTGFLAVSMEIADFNHDGTPDLLTADRSTAQFTLRPGIPSSPTPNGTAWVLGN